MLKNVAAPFPLTGSFALAQDAGGLRLVRIQQRWSAAGQQMALISFHGTTVASGNRTVPLADLVDGSPLTGAEIEEKELLFDALLARKARKPKGLQARFDALRGRAIAANLLDSFLRRAGLAAVMA